MMWSWCRWTRSRRYYRHKRYPVTRNKKGPLWPFSSSFLHEFTPSSLLVMVAHRTSLIVICTSKPPMSWIDALFAGGGGICFGSSPRTSPISAIEHLSVLHINAASCHAISRLPCNNLETEAGSMPMAFANSRCDLLWSSKRPWTNCLSIFGIMITSLSICKIQLGYIRSLIYLDQYRTDRFDRNSIPNTPVWTFLKFCN